MAPWFRNMWALVPNMKCAYCAKCTLWREVCFMAWSVFYGVKCVLWREVCFMAWSVLCGVRCALWREVCFMARGVLYGARCALWREVCFMAWGVLYGVKCALWREVCFMAWSLLYGVKCALWRVLLNFNLHFLVKIRDKNGLFTARYELNIEIKLSLIFFFKVLNFTVFMTPLEFIYRE